MRRILHIITIFFLTSIVHDCLVAIAYHQSRCSLPRRLSYTKSRPYKVLNFFQKSSSSSSRYDDVHKALAYSLNPSNNEYTKDSTFSNTHHRPVIVIVAGATGYIGKAVVEHSVQSNFTTIALVRNPSVVFNTNHETNNNNNNSKRLYGNTFLCAHILQVDVTNSTQLQESISTFLQSQSIHSSTHDLYFVSCLASPIGTRKEAYTIDYQASLNLLHTAQHLHAYHFCLLSAFCVRRPFLQLQQAKLKMEAELQNQHSCAQNDITKVSWSIIRPTAFLKSISGQFESILKGNSYVVFGNGAVTQCNPISQQDLADFMFLIMMDPKKHNLIYNIGGPDEPLTPKMLGEKMFTSISRTPKFTYAPTFVFDFIISLFQTLADWTQWELLEDSAEYARIGKYYAVEDMLTTHPKEKYGKITVQDHYNIIAAQGQDPFTPIRATSVISRVLESMPLVLIASLGIISYSTLHGEQLLAAVGS